MTYWVGYGKHQGVFDGILTSLGADPLQPHAALFFAAVDIYRSLYEGKAVDWNDASVSFGEDAIDAMRSAKSALEAQVEAEEFLDKIVLNMKQFATLVPRIASVDAVRLEINSIAL